MKTIEELNRRRKWTEEDVLETSREYSGRTRRQFMIGNHAAFSAARRMNLFKKMTWLKPPVEFHKWNPKTIEEVENVKWRKNNHGYLVAIVNGRSILKHRLVMEMMIGRKLLDEECVHHRDGNKMNNRPDNLEIIDRSFHTKMHNSTTRKYKRGYSCNISDEGRRKRSETAKNNRQKSSARFEEKLKTLGMTRQEYFKKREYEYRLKHRDKRIAYAKAYYQSHKEGWNNKKGNE